MWELTKKPSTLQELLSVLKKNKGAFPVMITALEIALTLPVTSSSCERAFSVMKLIKTYLRNATSAHWLSDLGMISMNKTASRDLAVVDILFELKRIHPSFTLNLAYYNNNNSKK